jgi:hypothetical protein
MNRVIVGILAGRFRGVSVLVVAAFSNHEGLPRSFPRILVKERAKP